MLLFLLSICLFAGNLHGAAAKPSIKIEALRCPRLFKEKSAKPESNRAHSILKGVWARAEKKWPCMTSDRNKKPHSYDLACILAAYDLKKAAVSEADCLGYAQIIEELEQDYDNKYAKTLEHSIK